LKKKLNFIILGKGMMIRVNIGRNTIGDERNGMIMNTTKRRKALRSGKNSLVFGDDTLEVRLHHRCLSCLNRMELGNNVGMNFFEELFHSMGTNNFRAACCDSLEFILLSHLLEFYG
jgi:hypothetical protein